jgi:hypothetical protein
VPSQALPFLAAVQAAEAVVAGFAAGTAHKTVGELYLGAMRKVLRKVRASHTAYDI